MSSTTQSKNEVCRVFALEASALGSDLPLCVFRCLLVVEKLLGTERRNSIFASIYLMRADAMPTVRTAAYRVWKSVVQNTARMLQTLLPAMMNIIVYDLAGGSEERIHVTAQRFVPSPPAVFVAHGL